MKKLIFTFTIMMASVFSGYSQEEDLEHAPAYITFTSKNFPYKGEGMYRGIGEQFISFKTCPINYSYLSNEKGVELFFIYVELDLEVRARDIGAEIQYDDTLKVFTYPIKFIEENNFTDIDELFSGMSKEEIWEFADGLKGKRIYFVDKNPEFKEITYETVKVTQVKFLGTNKPINDVVN